MTAHTSEQQEFIVLRLARFEPPSVIIDAFEDRWPDTDCKLSDLTRNDPGRGSMLSPELHKVFMDERQRILLDPHAAPTADKRARLIELQRMFEKARDNNQADLASRLLRQIADETDEDEDGDLSRDEKIVIERRIIRPAKADKAA